MTSTHQPILNIIVIGFHHKKGCQVEFCYPEIIPGCSNELPSPWKHLPALALPDGSHNYLSDTVFFHLPGLTHPAHTVYAVSCFRQIPVEQVVERTSDMTRSSVQKSVCVISKLPLFGRLAIKIELVVREWFIQGDFSKTKLLEDAFKHLSSCPLHIDQIYDGLSATLFVELWRHKALLLFKLILLQRKVVLYGSPAGPLTSCLLTLLSLLPGCLQEGLSKSANIVLSRPLSPTNTLIGDSSEIQNSLQNNIEEVDNITISEIDRALHITSNNGSIDTNILIERKHSFHEVKAEDVPKLQKNDFMLGREKCHSVGEKYKINKAIGESQSNLSISRDISVEGLNNFLTNLNIADCGLPMNLFQEGYLCLPYLSLQYLDVLADPAVKGFVIGASNILFKQKRHLFDVLVEATDMRLETADLALRRQLQLTTEDLRFADHILRHGPTEGETWIRDQFGGYLLCLLKTSLLPEGSREIDYFNASFVGALRNTLAYKDWLINTENGNFEAFTRLSAGHPFSGQLSVTDMKLRLSHTMNNTDGGRKVTQAVMNTTRAVANTSRVVGGVLSQAKGALSVWLSTFTTPSPQVENLPESEDPEHDVQEASPEYYSQCNHSYQNVDTITYQTDIPTQPVEPISVFCGVEEKNSCSDAEEALESKKSSTSSVTAFDFKIPEDNFESDNIAEDALQVLQQLPKSVGKIEMI